MPLVSSQQSIFDTDAEIIANPVNCIGISGAGLAKQFAKRFPDETRAYQLACSEGLLELGGPPLMQSIYAQPGKYICYFPTKHYWREASQLSKIELSLAYLADQLEAMNAKSIALPKLGCGLGQLEWHDVRESILQMLGQSQAFANGLELILLEQ